MKKIITLISFSLLITNGFSQGTWSQKAPCIGSPRYRAVAFEINGKCYMGTGSTGGGISLNRKDMWVYNTTSNSWTQIADLSGDNRTNATSSSDGTYGYIGLGSNNGTLLNDWWMYDPAANMWSPKTAFPGVPRFGASSFFIQNRIFVGGGLDSMSNPQTNFYAYDPVSDTWAPKASIPIGVATAATFTIGGKGYFVGGLTNGSIASTTQNAEYDPINDTWTTKAPYPMGNVFSAVGFAIGAYGYVGTGFCGSLTDSMFMYDPSLDYWSQETSWPTGVRQWAVSCVSGNRAFVGTGNSTGGNLYSDWWEFIPASVGIKNVLEENAFNAMYSSFGELIVVNNIPSDGIIRIYNVEGKLIIEKPVSRGNQTFIWNRNGIFIVEFSDGVKKTSVKVACKY